MDDEIDLRRYLNILWVRRRIVVAVTVAAILAAGVSSFLSPPMYETEMMLLPLTLSPEAFAVFSESAMISRKVFGKLAEGGARDSRPGESLTAKVIRGTNLVQLKVKGRDPNQVTKTANQWAAVVTTESERIFSPAGSVKLIAEAVPPQGPIAQSKKLTLTLVAFIGLMTGTMLAFAIEYLSTLAAGPSSRAAAPATSNPLRRSEFGE